MRNGLKNISGACESLITSYLMNLRITNCPIYISRHGESHFNVSGKLGGDSLLTENGILYSKKLNQFLEKDINNNFILFTSYLKRTIETSNGITLPNCTKIISRLLNEIHAGICENMTNEEIEEEYPNILKQRATNKLYYRYPEGESYMDFLERLQYFILQILSIEKPLVIIAHRAINRVLLGYFLGIPLNEIPHIDSNLNEVIKLTPNSKGYSKEVIKL